MKKTGSLDKITSSIRPRKAESYLKSSIINENNKSDIRKEKSSKSTNDLDINNDYSLMDLDIYLNLDFDLDFNGFNEGEKNILPNDSILDEKSISEDITPTPKYKEIKRDVNDEVKSNENISTSVLSLREKEKSKNHIKFNNQKIENLKNKNKNNDYSLSIKSNNSYSSSDSKLVKRSSTRRSVNDYSKSVQDCIQKVAPSFKNFNSQFSPSNEKGKKNELSKSQNSISKSKKNEKLSRISSESTKYVKDMDSNDSLIKTSNKINGNSTSSYTVVVNQVKDDSHNNIILEKQNGSHNDNDDKNNVLKKQNDSHNDDDDDKNNVLNEQNDSHNDDDNITISKTSGNEISSNSVSIVKSKSSKSKSGKKPASLLPRRESLKILKEQYPKEKIDDNTVYAAKCVNIKGRKSIKSQRYSKIPCLKDVHKMEKRNNDDNTFNVNSSNKIKKCQSVFVAKSSTNKYSNENKTKSLGNTNLQFCSRSSSLINPTSIPSTLLFSKAVLKAKQEGLPPKKRYTYKTSRTSSSLNPNRTSKISSTINSDRTSKIPSSINSNRTSKIPSLLNPNKTSIQNLKSKLSNSTLNKEQLMAKQSWETKDDDMLFNNRSSHRTRSRSFGPGDFSKYYMSALASLMANNGNFNEIDLVSNHQEVKRSSILSLRRKSVDSSTSDINPSHFAKINGLTDSKFTDLYLDIVQRNLSLEELLQRINQ